MSKNNLTENQSAVLLAIGQEGFYITDDEFTAVFDSFAADLADRGTIKDKKTAKVVINQLLKKRIFEVETETGDSILSLTDHGKDAITEAMGLDPAEDPAEEPETDEEDLLGDVAEEVHTQTVEEAAEEAVAKVQTDTYTELSWTDADDVEWTETKFTDGSRTLKRRKKVSGSWRTDYWGVEFEGDKERYTTAKFAKMARAYGTFSHNPIV